jgi:preprotein translocase subunit YajC
MEGESPSIIIPVLYFAFLLGIMYLIFFLPQRKREKKTRQMLDALRVGDEIVTIGGITGTVLSMKDDEITIESSIQKTKISIKKWAVKEVKELIKA